MPAVGNPDIGIVTYNGYTFQGATRMEANTVPVYTEDMATAKHYRHTITIEGYLKSPDALPPIGPLNPDMDTEYATMRQLLTVPGQNLIVDGKGFGKFNIGGADGAVDKENGPHPRVLAWRPIGLNRTIFYKWEITFATSLCDSQNDEWDETKPISINYAIDIAVRDGLVARNISGTIGIDQGLKRIDNGLREWDVSLEELEAVFFDTFIGDPNNPGDGTKFDCPPDFKRSFSRTFQAGRGTLTFNIQDTQIPSPWPFPRHATNISGGHNVNWNLASAGMYTERINITIELGANSKPELAWAIFASIVRDRTYKIDPNTGQLAPDPKLLLVGLDADEVMYSGANRGGRIAFSASYRRMGPVKDFIADSNMLTDPTPDDYDWADWKEATYKSTKPDNDKQHPENFERDYRGIDRITMKGNTQLPVGPCQGLNADHSLEYDKNPYERNSNIDAMDVLWNDPEKINAGSSHTDYREEYDVYKASGMSIQEVLQPDPGDTPPASGGCTDPSTGIGANNPSNTENEILHVNSKPKYYVVVRGYAERAHHKVAEPGVDDVYGGVKVREIARIFNGKLKANVFGAALHTATWTIVYAAENAPKSGDYPDRIPFEVFSPGGNEVGNATAPVEGPDYT